FHIGSLKQFINEHEPFLLVIDEDDRIFYAMHFIIKIAFSFYQIISHIYITEYSVKQTEFHLICRNTHAEMSKKKSAADGPNKSAFPGHIGSRQKYKIASGIHFQIVGNR